MFERMVGLATQLVRAMGACSTLSYAGYIADFVMLSWLEYLLQSSHGFDDGLRRYLMDMDLTGLRDDSCDDIRT